MTHKNAPIKGRSADLIILDDLVNIEHSYLTTKVIDKIIFPSLVSGVEGRRFWYRFLGVIYSEPGCTYTVALKLLPDTKT